jgi:hypothetical protein
MTQQARKRVATHGRSTFSANLENTKDVLESQLLPGRSEAIPDAQH